jgi:scyllo-inositol 2-dehydrogenase (NADP+)
MEPKQINVALCAFGMSGWVFHAPFIHAHPGFNLYGVLERSQNKAAEKYPTIKTFRSLHELLADDNIDLVVVNTPSITHLEFATKALQHGKHVIVEKPFTATAAEASELIALAAANNRQLSVFHNRRYDSDFLTVKKIIQSGSLGQLKEASIYYDRFTPTLSPKPHKEAPTPAVGVLFDLGSHLIDSALQLFGTPQAVFADIMRMRNNTLVDDYFEILFYYPDSRVRLKATFFAKEPQGFVIHGTKGSFIKSRSDTQEKDLQAGKPTTDADWGLEPATAYGTLHCEQNDVFKISQVPSERGHYGMYYEGIYQALQYGKPLPVTAQEGREVIRIIEAALTSSQLGKMIAL